jgi:ribosome-associated protein
MTTTTTTADKKDVQKLQRAIVDGLEDVKAIDIQVFNTEHLSPLFERVMIASGTSNRQTKALASSVRDAVRGAGFPKPRMEGEENGEWIIVDCGQAVVHIMQPAIRQYYHLEDLWGDKPVRLKFGAAKPALPSKQPVRQAVQPAAKTGGLKRSSAAKQGVELAFPSKAQEKRNAAQKVAAKKVAEKKAAPRKTSAKTALKTVLKTTASKSAAKPATKAPAKAAAKTRKRTD